MKKAFTVFLVVFFLLAVGIVCFSVSLPPNSKEIIQINLYLEEYDTSTYNENHIIKVTDKKNVKEIIDIMGFKNRKFRLYREGCFAHNPPGYVDIIFKNGKIKHFFYLENKSGFICYEKQQPFYSIYANNSYEILFSKYY